MALTAEEAELIRTTFRAIARDGRGAAERFYEILFAQAPHIRALFVNDMERQGTLLMSKLGLVVAELQNMAALAPVLEDLALRHVAYGVRPEHYPLVGAALVQMLEERLGAAFTAEAGAAWAKAYDELSAQMIRSAYSQIAAAK